MNRSYIWTMAITVFVFAAGCSDDAGSNDKNSIKAPVVPCGGDVVGTWNMSDAYIPGIDEMLSADAPSCKDALTDQATVITGKMTFSEAGTSNINGSLSQSVAMSLTEPCLRELLGNETITISDTLCDGISLILSSTNQSPFDAAVCNQGENVCKCEAQRTTSIVSQGTYTLPGDNTIVDEDNKASPYCVNGDTMLIETTAEGGATINIRLTQ